MQYNKGCGISWYYKLIKHTTVFQRAPWWLWASGVSLMWSVVTNVLPFMSQNGIVVPEPC